MPPDETEKISAWVTWFKEHRSDKRKRFQWSHLVKYHQDLGSDASENELGWKRFNDSAGLVHVDNGESTKTELETQARTFRNYVKNSTSSTEVRKTDRNLTTFLTCVGFIF